MALAEKWTAPTIENCSYVTTSGRGSSGTLKLFSRALFTNVPMGPARVTSSNINTAMFKNDSRCKPGIANSISTQNFITARGPFDKPYTWSRYPYGGSVQVEYHGKDMASITAYASEIDNSVKY